MFVQLVLCLEQKGLSGKVTSKGTVAFLTRQQNGGGVKGGGDRKRTIVYKFMGGGGRSLESLELSAHPSCFGESDKILETRRCWLLQVFRPRTPPEAIQLVSRLLEYTPSARIQPMEACAHAFFDELRDPASRLPNGRELPPLFNFTATGWSPWRRATAATSSSLLGGCGGL